MTQPLNEIENVTAGPPQERKIVTAGPPPRPRKVTAGPPPLAPSKRLVRRKLAELADLIPSSDPVEFGLQSKVGRSSAGVINVKAGSVVGPNPIGRGISGRDGGDDRGDVDEACAGARRRRFADQPGDVATRLAASVRLS